MQIRFFDNRAFAVDNVVLFLISIAFVPMFLFASLYSQISLGDDASQRRPLHRHVLRRLRDRRPVGRRGSSTSGGAKAAVVTGCTSPPSASTSGANTMPDLAYSDGGRWWRIVIAGVGTGMVLGPVSTDALNRAPDTSYGEVTGITQTTRNLGASLGLGDPRHPADLTEPLQRRDPLDGLGCRPSRRPISRRLAQRRSPSGGDASDQLQQAGSKAADFFHAVQHAFALSSETIFFVMAIAMALAGVVALAGSRRARRPRPRSSITPTGSSASRPVRSAGAQALDGKTWMPPPSGAPLRVRFRRSARWYSTGRPVSWPSRAPLRARNRPSPRPRPTFFSTSENNLDLGGEC